METAVGAFLVACQGICGLLQGNEPTYANWCGLDSPGSDRDWPPFPRKLSRYLGLVESGTLIVLSWVPTYASH